MDSQILALEKVQSAEWSSREELRATLPSSVIKSTIPLLVAMSGQLGSNAYTKLGPLLWSKYLDEATSTLAAPVRMSLDNFLFCKFSNV